LVSDFFSSYGVPQVKHFMYFLRSGWLGSVSIRNFVAETNGYSQAEFVGTHEAGLYRLQGSTNLMDWQVVPKDNGFPGLYINQLTRWPDSFPGYSGPRFYRAVNEFDTCISNLLVLNHIKALWAFEKGKAIGYSPVDEHLFRP